MIPDDEEEALVIGQFIAQPDVLLVKEEALTNVIAFVEHRNFGDLRDETRLVLEAEREAAVQPFQPSVDRGVAPRQFSLLLDEIVHPRGSQATKRQQGTFPTSL